jgi:hypothetical protein
VEVQVDGTVVIFRAGARYVELLSNDGRWKAEVRIDYRTGHKLYYVVTVVLVSQDWKAYLSLETNREEASALIRAMRGVPKNEKQAMRKAKEILDATKALVGSTLGLVLRA